MLDKKTKLISEDEKQAIIAARKVIKLRFRNYGDVVVANDK